MKEALVASSRGEDKHLEHRIIRGYDVSNLKDRNDLILEYAPYIKYLAHRLASRLPDSISVDDLISVGVIGLIDAIEKFDPSFKTKFKTYAEFRIKGAMIDELRSMDWIPRSVRKKSQMLEDAYLRLESKLGRAPDDNEVAEELGLNLDEFYKLLDQAKGVTLFPLEIWSGVDENDTTDLRDSSNFYWGEDPVSLIDEKEKRILLAKALEQLSEKERLVLTLYYYEELTMKEIAHIMGYTESRISQIHTKAILKLKVKIKKLLQKNLYPGAIQQAEAVMQE